MQSSAPTSATAPAPPVSPPASATAQAAPESPPASATAPAPATGAEEPPSGAAPSTPASLSRPKRAGAAKASEAIKQSLKQQDARIAYQDPEASGEGAQGEDELGSVGGGTLAADAAGGRKSGRGRGRPPGRGGRGGAPAAKAKGYAGKASRMGAPLQLRPIWRPSLSSEAQAAAVVIAEFAATFLAGPLGARGLRPPTPTELHRALAAGAGRAGEALLDALHMVLLQVLLEDENLAVDDAEVEPDGPGVAGAAVLKLADLLRFMSALSWPELLRQAVLHWEASAAATGKGAPPQPEPEPEPEPYPYP